MPELLLGHLVELVGGRLVGGDPSTVIRGAAPPDQAGPHDVTMALSPRYWEDLGDRPVGAVLVAPGRAVPGRACVEVADPRGAFDRILELFAPEPWMPDAGVHPAAVVDPSARLGEGVRIGALAFVGRRARLGRGCAVFPGAVIGDDAEIGELSVIHANAVIRERVRVGARVIIGPGAVIGSEGFGFATEGGRHRRRPQIGTVIIEDDVEVGANACIDRASCGATVVGRGAKIDNLVQIAHNVRVGPHAIVVGQVGIAGSARIGAGAVLAGQAGVRDHVRVGDGAVVAARTMVIEDVEPGARVAGEPAMPHTRALRVWAAARRLPELAQRLQELEARIGRLEAERSGGRRPEGG